MSNPTDIDPLTDEEHIERERARLHEQIDILNEHH